MERRKSSTHKENKTSIVIPVTIVLFLKEGRKDGRIFGGSLQFRGIETTCCSPSNFVPIRYDVRNGVNRSRHIYRFHGRGNIVWMSFDVLDVYRGDDVRVSSIDRKF